MTLTLVLDQGFQPIDLKPWQDAMVDWANDKVEFVATYAERIVHRGRALYMPAIVRFTQPTGKRKRLVRFSRDNIYLRDKGACQYCGRKVSRSDMQYDHVVPRAQGGLTTWANIVVCCHKCNQRKGGRTPEQAGMRLRQTPVAPKSLPGRARQPPRLPVSAGSDLSWHVELPEEFRAQLYWAVELEP